MLKKGRKIQVLFLILLVWGCKQQKSKLTIQEKARIYKEMVNKVLSDSVGQELLYKRMSDTLENWMKNDLRSVNKFGYLYSLDSTICINSSGDKIIGAELHFLGIQRDHGADGITEFFGAKIKGKWYFWTGGYMPVIRSAYKNHDPKKPLSYAQLHKAAMENFLGGYLTKDGEINDKWFEGKFKGGYIPYKDRYIYKHILDGQRIDDEKDFWDYQWKKAGLMNWIMKSSNDSIGEINNLGGERLTREQENEIRMSISRKMLAE